MTSTTDREETMAASSLLSPARPGVSGGDLLKLMRILRSAGAALLAQAAVHGQLAQVEWAREKRRLARMLVALLLVAACVLCMMLFGGVLVLTLSWDTGYRIAAVLGLIGVYALIAALGWRHLLLLAARGEDGFAATREELAADIALIRSKL